MLFNKSLATFGRYLMLMGRTFSRPERMRMFFKHRHFLHEPRSGKKVAKNRFFLICDACRITKDSPNQKDCPLFINRFFLFLGR